ncbi:3-phosphoinositide-dependent protein kinase 1 [Aphelenchoides besseyi]|nr:3-phosphoinositide-dependent protein kinase 1 [Aphelenchoides besseyi]
MDTGASRQRKTTRPTKESQIANDELEHPIDRIKHSASPTLSAGNLSNSDPTSSSEDLYCAQRNAAKDDEDFWDMSEDPNEQQDRLGREVNDDFYVSDQTTLLAQWNNYTTLYIKRDSRFAEDLYDDLIAHSMDDYNEKAERQIEYEAREKPIPFGPITRDEHIRLAFCRVKRHNARSTLPNKKADDYYFIRHLGEGSFSTVYQARQADTDEMVAIKVMNKRQILRERKTQYVTREKDIMATLSYGHGGHPFIAQIICTFQEPEHFVLSYAENGELLSWLRRLGSFDKKVSKFYASELVSALEYMHDCGIVHRDLKPENVLIKSDWHIMISDFGSAKVIGYDGDDKTPPKSRARSMPKRGTFVGTAHYISPEVACGSKCGPEADYWALGVIIFQMISGQPPFRGMAEYQILRKITTLQYRFPEGFDDTAKDLVQQLLIVDAEKRLGYNGTDEIKFHEYFKDVDWKTITTRTPPTLKPYLPASCGEPEFYSEISCPQEMKTGLGKDAMVRLMGMGDGKKLTRVVSSEDETEKPSQPPSEERRKNSAELLHEAKIESQRREHPYHSFVEDSIIIKSGLIDKKKGLFARRRMFLLTENGRLYYVDPVQQELRGEIPITTETKTEAKNFRTFFVHTPHRTYYLFDPARRAQDWCDAIDQIRDACFATITPDTPKTNANRRRGKSWGRGFRSSKETQKTAD